MIAARFSMVQLGLALLALAVWFVQAPVQAQSLLRDAETESLLHEASRPIFEAAGLQPSAVQFYLVGDPTINAFVAGGQNIFMHSGLMLKADNFDEVLGVIAHETGHISGGHLARSGDMFREATAITMLSMLLGAAAIAAGSGDAGQAILLSGQSAATASFLAYSRVQESAADQAGAQFLDKAGISGRGFITFFQKLLAEEAKSGEKQNGYWRSHPLTEDRIERLEDKLSQSRFWNTPPNPKFNERFLRVRAKLAGFSYDPSHTLNLYPETDTSIYGRLARAYAFNKAGEPEKVRGEVNALVEANPSDPYFLELQGQMLLENGFVQEAIVPLRKSVSALPNQPLIMTTLGHALVASDDNANLAEAKKILESAVRLDRDNPFAWFQLGVVYGRQGDTARASLATAERYNLIGQPPQAIGEAKRAMSLFKQGTPEWIRAQDILLVSQEQLKRLKERRRG
jgi:predicted Zn-dependent protease